MTTTYSNSLHEVYFSPRTFFPVESWPDSISIRELVAIEQTRLLGLENRKRIRYTKTVIRGRLLVVDY